MAVTSADSRTQVAADADASAWPEDAVEVGRIADAWGIKGWFKVLSYSSDAQALFAARRWFLKPSEERAGVVVKPATALPPLLKILSVRDHSDGMVASAQDVTDRNAAEALRGARIFVSRSYFPAPETGEYYWVDLIGLAVLNRQGDDLGVVSGLLDTGPHSVLRITPAGMQAPVKPELERLIPFVDAYVDEVSLAERRITVDWGLDY